MEEHHGASLGHISLADFFHHAVKRFPGIHRVKEDAFRPSQQPDIIVRWAKRLFVTRADIVVKDLLEILRLAPTSVNYQPVQYFVAETEEERAAVAAGVSDFNQERVIKASRAIVCAVPFRPSEEHLQAVYKQEIADGRYAGHEGEENMDAGRRYFVGLHAVTSGEFFEWASKQAYLSMCYLMFAAAQMGLDTTIMEGVQFQKMDENLGLAEKGLASVLVLAIGHHDEKEDRNATKQKSRLPMDTVIHRVAK